MLEYDSLEDSLRPLYREALEALTQCQPRIPIYREPELMNRIFLAVLTDHPELFWFDGRWQLLQEGDRRYALPRYLFTGAVREVAREQIAFLAKEALQPGPLPPRRRAEQLYDWLLNNVAYGMGDTRGQTVFDVFINRCALCKGLSKAYQLLLREAGIPSTLAEGTLDGVTRHVWNIVQLDGALFHADVSMGYARFSYLFPDSLQADPHRCLLVSEDQLRLTHQIYQGR